MDAAYTIRQAVASDTSEIAEFLTRAACLHRHLDWQGVLDWIPFSPFLLLKNEKRLIGLLTCPPDLEKIAWIRCFACNQYVQLPLVWNSLFQQTQEILSKSGTTLYSVGLNDWFAEILRNSGFENFQDIVVLQWTRHMPSINPLDQPSFIRAMETGDLSDVALLDRTAFEPMWVNPEDKIGMAFTQAEHASVAEVNGRIVGYEMTTANHFSAQLARIAVHPDFQQHHIGSILVAEMLTYFRRKGIDQITVNTQNNNASSLALYRHLGFELTGESFPVFRFCI